MTLISAQKFRSQDIVAAKLAARDFVVAVSPAFTVDGFGEFVVILDGHHSLEAALEAGVEPEFVEQTTRENDTVALIESDMEAFLAANWIDCDYYDVATGQDAF